MELTNIDARKHRCLVLRYPGSGQFKWPLQKTGSRHIIVPVSGHLDADAAMS